MMMVLKNKKSILDIIIIVAARIRFKALLLKSIFRFMGINAYKNLIAKVIVRNEQLASDEVTIMPLTSTTTAMTTSEQSRVDSELVQSIFKLLKTTAEQSEDLFKKLFTTVDENTDELQVNQFILVSYNASTRSFELFFEVCLRYFLDRVCQHCPHFCRTIRVFRVFRLVYKRQEEARGGKTIKD